MFGTFRFFLAILVVLIHLTGLRVPAYSAVFGFFMLSGYLMTLITTQNYGFGARGMTAYGVNRLLRIYPMYWVSCGLAIVILLVIGPLAPDLRTGQFGMPNGLESWVQNIGLILAHNTKPLLIQPGWTLTVELFFYICIGLGLSRNKPITLVWLISSVAYLGYMVAAGTPFAGRFFTIAAATLPFALGATMYHWRDLISRKLSLICEHPWAPLALVSLFLINWLLSLWMETFKREGFYLSVGILALIIISLFNRKELPFVSKTTDRLLGDLSYPVYLIHSPLAWLLLVLSQKIGIPLYGPSALTFVLFIAPILLVSYIMHITLEERIERVRAHIKQRFGIS